MRYAQSIPGKTQRAIGNTNGYIKVSGPDDAFFDVVIKHDLRGAGSVADSWCQP